MGKARTPESIIDTFRSAVEVLSADDETESSTEAMHALARAGVVSYDPPDHHQ